jgi:hypothetical protein
MPVRPVVGDGLDPSVTPKRFGFGAVSRLEGIEPAARAVRASECLQQVLDWRVVGCVTQENEPVPAKQGSNELCGPALGQVGPSKIGARKDKLVIKGAVIGVGDAAVEVNNPIKVTRSPRIR